MCSVTAQSQVRAATHYIRYEDSFGSTLEITFYTAFGPDVGNMLSGYQWYLSLPMCEFILLFILMLLTITGYIQYVNVRDINQTFDCYGQIHIIHIYGLHIKHYPLDNWLKTY